MLIEASSRKRQAALPSDAAGMKFATEERRSSLPAWIGLGLGSLFAYLKQWIDGTSPVAAHEAAPTHAAPEPAHALATGAHADLAVAQLDESARPQPHALRHRTAPHLLKHDEESAPVGQAAHIRWTPSIAAGDGPIRVANDNRTFSEANPAIQTPLPRPADVPLLPASLGSIGASVAPAIKLPSSPTPSQPAAQNPEDPAAPTTNKTNRSPMAQGPVTLNSVIAGSTTLVALGDLLLGTSDADGDTLLVQNLHASAGTLEQSGAGWVYHAPAGAETLVTLSYSISDGTESIDQTSSFRVLSPVRTLTDGNDVHADTDGADQIEAGEGNDNVDARGGDDLVLGGGGDDHLVLGTGNDIAHGGTGNDVIFGGFGDDILSGGAGDDWLYGEAGNDLLDGGDGNDYLSGGEGDDVLDGGAGSDILLGDAGDDRLDGGVGDDVVYGGDGNDLVRASGGNDLLDGGNGYDTLDLSAGHAGLVVDLVAGTAESVETGRDDICGFEAIVGGSGDDLFRLGDDDVLIAGGAGDDTYVAPNAMAAETSAHYEITDFAVGDRIVVGDYTISERNAAAPEFAEVYDDTPEVSPIRVSDERFDDLDVTVVSVVNGDDAAEISIWLHGQHDLLITHPIAV